MFVSRRSDPHYMAQRVKIKKKVPLAVDIIAGIFMLILVCAVIIGTYMLFRYYSNDYEGVEITYTVDVYAKKQDLARYMSMRNEEVFMDKDSNAVFFGKITSVEVSEKTDHMQLTVKADAKYRLGEGYSIGYTKVAVGSRFTLRCGEESLYDVTVVGLEGGN